MVSVLGPYAAILRRPGAARLVAASLGARLSFGLFDLALILLAERESGSFGLAGLAVGVHAAGIGLTAPLRGRLLDRFGARRVLAPFCVVQAVSIAVLPLVGVAGSDATLVVLAAVAGVAVPPLVPAMRLEWQRMLAAGSPELATAYAFDTVTQIGVFLVGPLLAAGGVALAGPPAPLLAAAALVLAFGLVFARLAEAQPSPSEHPTRGLGAIRIAGVRTLVIATVLADAALGIVDVAVVAFAARHGHDFAGGLLLAVFTTGAVIGGTIYGSRAWRTEPIPRLVVVLAAFSAVLLTLGRVDSIAIFAVLLLLAGAPSAAQWATSSVALDDVTPDGQHAEAYTWLSSANAPALGGVLAGALIDAHGTPAAFLAAGALAAAAALVVFLRRPNAPALAAAHSDGPTPAAPPSVP